MMRIALFFFLMLGIAMPAAAQDREVPYWATVRAEEVNMRVGPSINYPIDWVYRRKGLPVKVVRLYQGWRLVQDPDGTQGWIVARLLSPQRGAIVIGDGLAEMRGSPETGAQLLWNVEPGVVGTLGDCRDGWCEFRVKAQEGWVREDRLWGAGEP
ncbi:SH3-like domain-containing protein [Altererythrobacter atlanticus]|uniref:Bacterial SH3 domain protein n=1 Tax=Croceibacterium atlanticum TaxID=1267766 RepID=A0A0F7KQ68_9SPHN|nr:SH3 domain-containing protein [Croceibacterium atlanticum]AKH41694.1 Bacterial SH3 domain protein [Croceibacterium atlanticum]MBB5733158.1 SH3-like domain-containing protein [Croceibacterium atlanticum]